MRIIVSNILDMVKESGVEAIKEFVSQHSCEREIEGGKVSLNPDIERFLKDNAIQFARQKISVSYRFLYRISIFDCSVWKELCGG